MPLIEIKQILIKSVGYLNTVLKNNYPGRAYATALTEIEKQDKVSRVNSKLTQYFLIKNKIPNACSLFAFEFTTLLVHS